MPGKSGSSACIGHGPDKLLLCARQWPSYFQLPVLMLMLITLLNDGTLISIGYDRALASTRPEKWNLRQIFFMASVLGLVACLSSLLLLWMCLDAHNPGSAFQRMGLPAIEYGKIITLIYLKACTQPEEFLLVEVSSAMALTGVFMFWQDVSFGQSSIECCVAIC